jgi:hypothetical protein
VSLGHVQQFTNNFLYDNIISGTLQCSEA